MENVLAPDRPMLAAARNLAGIVRNPRSTFGRTVGSSDWLLMMALACLLSAAAASFYLQRFDWQVYTVQTLKSDPTIGQVTPAQLTRITDVIRGKITSFTYVSALLSPSISMLALAGIFFWTFRATLDPNLTYQTALGVVAYAWVPAMIKELAAIILLMFKHPSVLGPERVVPSNLTALIHLNPYGARYAIASSFDLFSVWTLSLLTIGFAAAMPKAGQWRIAARVLALWTLLVLSRAMASLVVEWMRAHQT